MATKPHIDQQAFRKRLEQMRLDRLRRIDADALAERESNETTEGPRVTYDSGDLATYENADSDRLQDAERATDELRQIEDALTRIRQGTYGICIDCGDPISPQRLELVPTATRDIACQQIHDQEHMTSPTNARL